MSAIGQEQAFGLPIATSLNEPQWPCGEIQA